MKGHLAITVGEKTINCLFGMTALLDFCKSKDVPFSDIGKVFNEENGNMFDDMFELLYHAHVCYCDYMDIPAEYNKRKIQLICDQGDLESILEGTVAAMFAGISTKKKVSG